MVKADETYFSGKSINKHASKRKEGTHGNNINDKTPAIGLVQRNGNVKTFFVSETSNKTMFPIVTENVCPSATLITHGYPSYRNINRIYNHVAIKHVKNKYVTEGANHTNTIERFWSLLKHRIVGKYHQVSPKHLHSYYEEIGYRYNTRKVSNVLRFNESIKNANGLCLTYANLIK